VGQELDLLVGDEIRLVDQDDVRELNLIDEQIDQGALVVRPGLLPPIRKQIGRVEVLGEPVRIHDRHHRVDFCNLGQGVPKLVGQVEGDGHRHRLRDAARLDHQVVEPAVVGQRLDLGEQVLPHRAADAAVRHFHQALLGLDEVRLFVDERGVDVDLGHVVDDDGDAAVLGVVEDVLEKCRLAGAEVAGENGNG